MSAQKIVQDLAISYLEGIIATQGRLVPEDIERELNRAAETQKEIFPLSDQEKDHILRSLEGLYQADVGVERDLVGKDKNWSPWLKDRRGEVVTKHWDRYKTLLSRKSFPGKIISRLESSTDRVINYLGDPNVENAWDRRGLVVGLVQSGKTAHYVGTINKAIDYGYKVIVVMTGFTESLRVQTQGRIEEGVLGYSLKPDPNDKAANRAKILQIERIKRIRPRIDSVTTLKNDFSTKIARNFAISVGRAPTIFVVKKNASVLRNLLSWVKSFGTDTDREGNNFVKGIPLLVVDDESDVGSVDTKKGVVDQTGEADEEHDPSKINKQIRKLLSLFDQSSYVGYTATPFANVLIHDQGKVGIDSSDGLLIGEDLYPRSFIVSLPTPTNHVGPSMVFGSPGLDGERSQGLPIKRVIDDTQLGDDPAEFWMPNKHDQTHVPIYLGEEKIPPPLREAVLSFILVIAARKLRGHQGKHNSMLVHVTRLTLVQRRVFEQIEEFLQELVMRLVNRTGHEALLAELRLLWEEGRDSFVSTTTIIGALDQKNSLFQNPIHSWSEIEVEIFNIIGSVEVRTINGFAKDVLDYDENSRGLNVIAVGGDKLARGLTLEGLSISYFLRCSRMYDTLMQMGRWFGYRPGYVDLCRLYTTDDLQEWFAHIADATEELREEFNFMANIDATPANFGLKIRSHSLLMVTSYVKSRSGTRQTVSFDGALVQTTSFNGKAKIVSDNWNSAQNLVSQIEKNVGESGVENTNKKIWSDVKSELIIQFLENYFTHKEDTNFRVDLLRKYIQKQNEISGLKKWTVLLSGGQQKNPSIKLGSSEVRQVTRGLKAKKIVDGIAVDDHFVTGTLVSRQDEGLDLSDPQQKQALRLDIEDWEKNGKMRRGRVVPKPIPPSVGRFSRQVRSAENGLLILYPILPENEFLGLQKDPILGVAISFPSTEAGANTPVDYIVTNICNEH